MSKELDRWSAIIEKRKLTDSEFTKLKDLKVSQRNSHEFSDQYDGSCDHCIKQELLLSQMTFSVTSFTFPPAPTKKEVENNE